MDTNVDLSKPDAARLNSPVHRLSEDILLDILLLVLGDTPASERYERLGELMLVCSQWGALIDAPSLWAHVSRNQRLSAMKRSLFKSKSAPLDIVYTSNLLDRHGVSTRPEVNDLLLKNVHRWRSFEFQGGSSWDHNLTKKGLDEAFMDRLHHLTAPNLNSISLQSISAMSFEVFFTAKTDRLRHISIRTCSIPWDSGLFSGLETLKLHHLNRTGPSFDRFITFLQASPNLVELSVWSWEPGLVRRSFEGYTEVIALQSLETFDIRDIDYYDAKNLLTILRIPKCTKFCLEVDYHPGRHPKKRLPMEHLFPMLREIMASCNETRIELHGAGLVFTSGKGKEEALKIKSALEIWPIEEVRRFLESTIATPRIHLTIHGEPMEAPLPAVVHLMESSYPIDQLSLVQRDVSSDPDACNQMEEILKLLSKSPGVDGVSRWLLPGIKILEIFQHIQTTHEWLISMIQSRYADLEPPKTFGLPERLQTLRIVGRNGITFSQLETMRGILGPGVVEYTPPKPEPHYNDSDELQDNAS